MDRKIVQFLSIGLFVTMFAWGMWTLFYYLGVPVHTGVFLGVDASNALDEFCLPNGYICRGVHAFFPFIQHTLTRVPFVWWYAAVCAALYFLYLGWTFVQTRQFHLQMTVKPWKIILLFVGLLWLFFTCLSFTQSSNLPIRTIIEPRPEVYQGAGDEALQTLQKNYDSLKERGCLTRIGVFGGVAEASNISMRCIQQSFFTRVIPPFLVVFVLLFEFLIVGRFSLRKIFRIHPQSSLIEAVVSLCIGACGVVVLLWLGAVFGIYTAYFGWGLMAILPLIGWKDTRHWVHQFFHTHWNIDRSWRSMHTILFWLLLSYLALNFLSVVRPFPIGWDDLGSYLNRPRLLVSYGTFVFSMASFQWEYITSLGFLLFGYNATLGATSALMINWLQGVLAVFAVYTFGRTFIGRGHGVLSALLFYTLPVIGHFSFADMKIDNAVFTMGAMAMFTLFFAVFMLPIEDRKQQYRWIALAGVFAAFTFSFKVTGVMVLLALGSILLGASLHWSAFIAAICFAVALLIKQGALALPSVLERLGYSVDISEWFFVGILLTLGGCVLGFSAWKARTHVRSVSIKICIFACAFAVTVLPWIAHNNILSGNIIPHLALGAPNNVTPTLDMFGTNADATYSLPSELAVDQSNPACSPSGAVEELGRYWGTRKGWNHYLTLPFRVVMNIDSSGYYVTTQPALLLFPLLLLLPFFWRKEGRWLRWMWCGTAFLIVEWAFLANGILWYGIGMFLGLVLCLEVLIAKAPDALSRYLSVFFVSLSLLACFGMRFWQYENQKNLFEYPMGKISAESIRERTIPYYDDITDIVLERKETYPNRPLMYRVGTFMPYFVPKNLEVIGIADHQLDFFNCLYQDRDNVKTAQRLKALGFNSIVFDTNTATIERDPNGSLHKKVQAFVDFLNSPDSELKVVINSPSAGITYILIP